VYKSSSTLVAPLLDRPYKGGRELKVHTLGLPASVITTAWNVDTFAGITQGLNWTDNRIGNRVHAFSLNLDAVVTGGQVNVITDDNRNTMRVVVSETVPGFTWGGGLTLNSILDPRVFNGLFRVLRDETIIMESPGRDSVGYLPAMHHFKFRIPLNMDVNYTGTGANVDSSRTFTLSIVSDSAVAPSPGFVSGAAFVESFDN